MSLKPPIGPDDHHQGRLDAPLVLVEYGDFECGYCGAAFPEVKQVQRALGDDLCFVFRNFPLREAHPHAERAAELAEAAGSAAAYWALHDLLYENQNALDDDSLAAYAQQAGLSRAAVVSAFEGQFAARVQHDFMGGVRSGVNGTPCFFINGRRYDGPADADSLYRALREVQAGA
ncbi:MAG TPA: thioredoxin domain-containing protein [Burkholderiaceae bacterium]